MHVFGKCKSKYKVSGISRYIYNPKVISVVIFISHSLNLLIVCSFSASLIAQLVKNPPVMLEAPVQFLHGEALLEKG